LPSDRRRALARRAGLDDRQRADIADRALADPDRFDAGDLRSWRIASPSWFALADAQLGPVERVERPVGVLVLSAALRDGWQLVPSLSLDAVRVIAALGGRLEHGLRAATLPLDAINALLERVNPHTLHAGGRECLDSGRALGEALTRALGRPLAPREARDRWGRLLVNRATHTGPDGTRRGELHLRVLTFAGRGFAQRRLGSAPRDQYPQPSASMDLGEAVQSAVDRGLPLLLAADARGRHAALQARAHRARARPGRRARQRRRVRRRLRRPRDAPALTRRARPRPVTRTAGQRGDARRRRRPAAAGGITAQTIAGVTGDEQVLVFAERVRCLRQLAETLRERHSVEAHVGDGGAESSTSYPCSHAAGRSTTRSSTPSRASAPPSRRSPRNSRRSPARSRRRRTTPATVEPLRACG
jgi:hypothetical protein